MAVEFREVEDRLVAVSGDAAAVWQSGAGAWKVLGVPMARKARLDGQLLTAAQVGELFPTADLTTVPPLSEPAQPAELPELAVQLDAIEKTIDEAE